MKSSLKSPTKEEQRRFYILKFEIGCLWHPGTPAEAHHLLSGCKRLGHMQTVPLCPECHWRVHNETQAFMEEHGTNNWLMLKETNKRVAEFEHFNVAVHGGDYENKILPRRV